MTEQEEFEFRLRLEREQSTSSPKKEEPKVSTLDYLVDRVKKGVSNVTSIFAEGAIAGQGSMSEVFTGKTGTYEPIKSEQIQKDVVGFKGLKAPNEAARYVGSGLEFAADPMSYAVPGMGTAAKAANAFISGIASEGGGDFGAVTEKAITGKDSGTGRAVGSIAGAVLSPTTTIGSRATTQAIGGTSKQIWDKYRNFKVDPDGSAQSVAAGSAKRLLQHAAEAQGAEKIDDIMTDFRAASQYVTGTDVPLLVAMADNPVLKKEVTRLVKTDPTARARLQAELDRVAQAIDRKSTMIFGERYAAVPAGEKGLKLTGVEKRVAAIDDQLEKLTDPFTASKGKTDIGTAVENLVEAKKNAVRARLSPEYEALKVEAREAKVKLPKEATQELYEFVKANRLEDVFGVETTAGKKIMGVLKPDAKLAEGIDPNVAALERAAGIEARTEQSFKRMTFDDIDSLKREINRLQRVTKDPAQNAKLRQLEEYFNGLRDKHIPQWSEKLDEIDKRYFQELGVPFGAQGVKDIDSAKYASRVAPVIVNNKQSFRDFIRVAGDEGVSIAENAMLSKAYDSIKGDTLTSSSLVNFMKKNKEVLDQPEMAKVKELLTKSVSDNNVLRMERARIETAAKQAQKRIADNFVTATGQPNYTEALTSIMNDPRARIKIAKDISDLGPEAAEAVRGSLRAELADRALNHSEGALAFLRDPKNRAGIEAVMGKGYQESLRKIALMSDNLRKADINKLTSALEKSHVDMVGKVIPGLDIPFVTSTIRDRISSTFQKGVRLVTRAGTAQLDAAYDRQLMELLTDPQGVQKLANTSSELNFSVKNPVEFKKLMSTLFDTMPANVYIGVQNSEEE